MNFTGARVFEDTFRLPDASQCIEQIQVGPGLSSTPSTLFTVADTESTPLFLGAAAALGVLCLHPATKVSYKAIGHGQARNAPTESSGL
jgi:hypothetical protein